MTDSRPTDSHPASSRLTLGAYNLEADDPRGLAEFWAAVLGSAISVNGDSCYLPPAGEGGFAVFLQPRQGPRPDHAGAHLDLTTPWGTREAEVARLVALGAEHRWDVLDEHPHVRWSTLADPEGTLFCIAEHPPVRG